VWKESILPFIFHGDIFVPEEHTSLAIASGKITAPREGGKVMEASEMTRVADDVPVKIVWTRSLFADNQDLKDKIETSTSTLDLDRLSLRSGQSQVLTQVQREQFMLPGGYQRLSVSEDDGDPTGIRAETG
jgi:hypothetical protein